MKKNLYSIVCLLFIFNYSIYAQDTIQSPNFKNEISVSTSKLSFNNVSSKYAKYISNDLWFKVGLIDLENSFHRYIPPAAGVPVGSSFKTTNSNLNGGLLIGIEKQKSDDKLELTYGLEAQMIYNKSNYTTENPDVPLEKRDIDVYKYSPGIGCNLGLYYKIIPSILFGMEINPMFSYSFINQKSDAGYADKKREFNFSVTNNGVLVTLKYRF